MKATLKRRDYTLIYHSEPKSIEIHTRHSQQRMDLLQLLHHCNLSQINDQQHQMYTEAIRFYSTCATQALSVAMLLWSDAKFEYE